MSDKYEKVKKYYDEGNWDIKRIKNAVVKNWITAEEYEIITGKKYEEK